jgi:hypothetical protein
MTENHRTADTELASIQMGISKRTLLTRRIVASVCTAGLMLQIGCYNTIPVTGANERPKGPVTIMINDRGRTLLGPKFGTLLDHLVATVSQADSAKVDVVVDQAVDVREKAVNWGGEPVSIPREAISEIQQRKLSKKASWSLAGAIGAGVVLFFALVRKTASSGAQDGNPGGGGGNPI